MTKKLQPIKKAMRKELIKFFEFITCSNFFISLCSLSLYLFYTFKAHGDFHIPRAIFIFCTTYLAYHFLRITPLKKGYPIGEEYINYYKKYSTFNYISIGLSAIYALFSLRTLNFFQVITLSISTSLVLFYERFFSNQFQLRSIPYLKPFIISMVWALLCTALYGIFYLDFFFDCFIFILLLTIPFDIRDQKSDLDNNIKTIALALGKRVYPLLGASYLVYTLIVFYFTHELFMPLSFFIYIALLKLSRDNSSLYYLGFDALIILRTLFYFFEFHQY